MAESLELSSIISLSPGCYPEESLSVPMFCSYDCSATVWDVLSGPWFPGRSLAENLLLKIGLALAGVAQWIEHRL